MPADISRRRLLVVSDSPVCKEAGEYIAFEPVVRELEAIAPLFDEIIWLGCRVKEKRHAMRAPSNHLPINIVAMPGVLNRYNSIRMLWVYPVFAYYLLRFVDKHTYIHTRGPSHPALLGILLSKFLPLNRQWHKYAGNWMDEKLAFTYKLQRRLLKRGGSKKTKVTVNGTWPESPGHILSFENPCFSNDELAYAISQAAEKDFSGQLNLVFVGNLTKAKGILQLVDAVQSEELSERFENLYIAGDGALRDQIMLMVANNKSNIKIHVLGHQNRGDIETLYKRCHVLILPTDTEGFPKVVAEGAAFGCIPVVTNVSAISQYVRHAENGLLMKDNTREEIIRALNTLAGNNILSSMRIAAQQMATDFTYERFVDRLKKDIFSLE